MALLQDGPILQNKPIHLNNHIQEPLQETQLNHRNLLDTSPLTKRSI